MQALKTDLKLLNCKNLLSTMVPACPCRPHLAGRGDPHRCRQGWLTRSRQQNPPQQATISRVHVATMNELRNFIILLHSNRHIIICQVFDLVTGSGIARGQEGSRPRVPVAKGYQRGAKKYQKWALGTKNPHYTTVCTGVKFPRYATGPWMFALYGILLVIIIIMVCFLSTPFQT